MTINTVLFLIIVFATHVVQSLAGFGGTMLAMPPSILLMGADTAKVVLNILALGMCVVLTVKEYRKINVKELIKMVAGMLIGMLAGIEIYKRFPLDILLKLYGAMIIIIAVKNLFFKSNNEKDLPKPVLYLVLLVSGMIHGMFVSGGALLVVYSSRVLKDKGEFRATVTALWIFTNSMLMFDQVRGGLYTPANMKLILMAAVPVAISMFVGNWLHKKINQEMFMKLTYVLLIISGSVALF